MDNEKGTHSGSTTHTSNDDKELVALGYKPSFKREFTRLPTISFAFSILSICSCIAITFNVPLMLGGPSSVVWAWFLGSIMCLALGSSIAEIVSAYPTCGGMYSASAYLTPKRHRPKVGWMVGWLNMLGFISGISSAEYGLSTMVWAAVYISKDGQVEITQAKIVSLFVALLIFHGLLNSLPTKYLALISSGFIFINLGTTLAIIVVLLAITPRSEMHPAGYVFGSAGLINQTGGWNDAMAFLLGLLSVSWTMTGYDATAHISEEVKGAAYTTPAAILMSIIGTGLIGWLFNIVLILCSGPIEKLPGPSGSAVLQIMYLRMGKAGALFLWTFVSFTLFAANQVFMQGTSRMLYAFSRDNGLPDRGFFSEISPLTRTPLRTVWLATSLSILPGLLYLANPIAGNAVVSLTAIALDLSYIIPIALRRLYHKHPEVMFKPGPFYLGDGLLGWVCNVTSISWILFVSVIFALPTVFPVTPQNMNYAGVITAGVIILTFIWYAFGAHRHYLGPRGGRLDGVDGVEINEKATL